MITPPVEFKNYLPRKTVQAIESWIDRIPQEGKDWIKWVTSMNLDSPKGYDIVDLRMMPAMNCAKPYLDLQLMMDLFKCSPASFQFTIRRKAGINHLKSLDNLTEDEQLCIQLAIAIKLKELHRLNQ